MINFLGTGFLADTVMLFLFTISNLSWPPMLLLMALAIRLSITVALRLTEDYRLLTKSRDNGPTDLFLTYSIGKISSRGV